MLNKYEIEIPNQVVRALGLMDKEVVDTIKKELAVYYFQRNMLSFGQARHLSSLSVWDFMDLPRERKVPFHYTETEYEEDSKTMAPGKFDILFNVFFFVMSFDLSYSQFHGY